MEVRIESTADLYNLMKDGIVDQDLLEITIKPAEVSFNYDGEFIYSAPLSETIFEIFNLLFPEAMVWEE